MAIRVLIVEDNRLFREALATVLTRESGFDVAVGTVCLAECSAHIHEFQPSVVLLHMTARDNISILQTIARSAPEARVIVLGVNDAEEEVIRYAEAGAAGYLLRDGSLDDLMATIVSVVAGETLCSPRVAATLLRRIATLAAERSSVAQIRLTAREREIVQLIDQGLSNKEIAQRLSIEIWTVKNHVHNILEKLHVHRRAEAAARLREEIMPPSAAQPSTAD